MYNLKGGCHCGNIVVEMALPRAPEQYSPRACDCDFCRKHGAAYLSDPQGSLVIRVQDQRQVGAYRQGSGIAECMLCRNCGMLVGVVYRAEGQLYATVNSRVMDGEPHFGEVRLVSPRLLSPAQKVERWQELWFADVMILSPPMPPHDDCDVRGAGVESPDPHSDDDHNHGGSKHGEEDRV